MSVNPSSIFGRLANQFRKSGSLFFSSHLSAEAIHHERKRPCQLSFTGAMQAMNAFLNAVAARGRNLEAQYQNMLLAISQNKVGDRPDRIEPRLVKQRPKP